MAEKKLPFSQAQLDEMLQKYPTPFHLYDEAAIRANVKRLLAVFSWAPDFKK